MGRKEEIDFPQTLIGEIERSIFIAEKNIKIVNTYLWITIILLFESVLIRRIIYFGNHSISGWIKAALAPLAAYFVYKMFRLFISKVLEPRKKNLITLQTKITAENSSTKI